MDKFDIPVITIYTRMHTQTHTHTYTHTHTQTHTQTHMGYSQEKMMFVFCEKVEIKI